MEWTREHKHAQTLRTEREIRLLHRKKQHLITQLYHAQIHNANTWQLTWGNIEQYKNKKLQQEMEKEYLRQQQKVANMTKTRTTDKINSNTNYARVESNTNV